MRGEGRATDDLSIVVPRPDTAARPATPRPTGWSPGAGALIAAWIAAGAIARLTGSPAVIALMAALLVAAIVDALTGLIAVRQPVVHGIVGPDVVDVGADIRFSIDTESPNGHARRPPNVSLVDPATGDLIAEPSPLGCGSAVGRFNRPGVVDALRVDVEAVGALGLLWWRRSAVVAVDAMHVAPLGAGALLELDRAATPLLGPLPARSGHDVGDIDGVRPWRRGESATAVHWPSSLRSGNLIVHDRAPASEQRWTVDLALLPDDPGVAARLRRTLDDGLRNGHRVSVIAHPPPAIDVGPDPSADSAPVVEAEVMTDADAARWAARVEQQRTQGVESTPPWRRPLRLRSAEPTTSIGPPARWAAAAAGFCALATLVGALGWSSTVIVALAAAMTMGAMVSLQIARRAGRRPIMLQVAIAVAIVGALVAIALDARNVDGLVAALRGPMPNLLMLLVVLHGFEVVDRRTLRVHQAIAFVVAAYAAGLRIDATLGWWLGAWAIAFFLSLWLTPRVRAIRFARTSAGSILRPVAWIAGSIVAALAVLSVVPIPDGPARLGLPALSNDAPAAANPGALVGPDGDQRAPTSPTGADRGAIGDVVGYPGFTETLDTSVRGDLGDEVVMRVRSPEPAFWRGQTFTEFDGQTWSVSPEVGRREDGPVIDIEPTLGDTTGGSVPTEELIQTYFVETDLPNLVFAAQRPTQVIFDGSLWLRPDGALRSDVTLTAGSIYTVVSERVQVTPDTLREQGDLGELFDGFRTRRGGSQIDPFLELPDSTSPRTIELATQLRTPGESTYDTILAYEAWLGANTEYDLDAPVPADGADAVDDFLFESRRGFCEQIASTLAIMLRSQGVPTRIATGYVSGERDRVSGVWKVRASDAHSWVEVWFPETGWQPFDPTASVPLAGEVDTGTVGGDLVAAGIGVITDRQLETAVMAVVATAGWAVVMAVRAQRRRRRRGRWGLLQDRFSALAPGPDGERFAADGSPPAPATNPMIAAALRRRIEAPSPDNVARTLDRAAFDPSWVDDDVVYEATRCAVAELETAVR